MFFMLTKIAQLDDSASYPETFVWEHSLWSHSLLNNYQLITPFG